MTSARRVLLIFQSIHRVLAAEAALEAAEIPADLVPVPKEVNPNCGMAITVAPADRERAVALLSGQGLVEVRDHWHG
ncbi:MAG: DUF3343 domain-containing protein [Planctomycetota bacterium]